MKQRELIHRINYKLTSAKHNIISAPTMYFNTISNLLSHKINKIHQNKHNTKHSHITNFFKKFFGLYILLIALVIIIKISFLIYGMVYNLSTYVFKPIFNNYLTISTLLSDTIAFIAFIIFARLCLLLFCNIWLKYRNLRIKKS